MKSRGIIVDDCHTFAGAVFVNVRKRLRVGGAALDCLLKLLPVKLAAALERKRNQLVQFSLNALKLFSPLLRIFPFRCFRKQQVVAVLKAKLLDLKIVREPVFSPSV